MTSVLFDGIGSLVTNDPSLGEGLLGVRRQAALLLEDGRVAWVGDAGAAPEGAADERVDVGGRCVIPGFVDSHTHLVFAGERSAEFAARMSGTSYQVGGIRATVAATRAASDAELDLNLARLVAEARRSGTTTIECKSGYGLTVDDEARSLRIAGRRVEATTFLGAHVVPEELASSPEDYVALVCNEMMDACAPLASFVDVFCDVGAFDADQADAVLRAGKARSLTAKVHANQLAPGPGVLLAVAHAAASADHCTHLGDDDIEALAASDTVATLLPAAEFSTRSAFAQGRRLVDAGATVAVASDCNPGTSFTANLAFCIALAVREQGLTVDEAVRAATLGGARALRRGDVGHLGVGALGDLVVLEAPSHLYLAYRPGAPLIAEVWMAGRLVFPQASDRSTAGIA